MKLSFDLAHCPGRIPSAITRAARAALPLGVLSLLLLGIAHAQTPRATQRPNILFVILDDVGIDQLKIFNPAAELPPSTPTLDTIAAHGVKFTNCWSMPECSPSRVGVFTGRWPLRTGVTAATLDEDLPASQISFFEKTTPQVLATAGYTSALIGKYHLGGPNYNPSGQLAPRDLGWDYFNGGLDAAPQSIDTTLGGQYTADKHKFSCGFPTGKQRGAGWFQRPNGTLYCDDNRERGYLGQDIVALGGIPALNANGELARTCEGAAGPPPDFDRANGYYVSRQSVVDSSGVRTRVVRKYATQYQTDTAISWIRDRTRRGRSQQPWMCTVSYNADHTPYQHPPRSLYPPGFVWPRNVPEDCTNPLAKRILSNLMISAMDREIRRLLLSTGLAKPADDGGIVYRPEATNTMIVIVGDNGSYLSSIKPPYQVLGGKGTPYQTGVTVPLIVAGPLVRQPGRSVSHMVNIVDLFQLFGEIAQVDVRRVVPPAHILDCRAVLPYLRNPRQPGIRPYNFTQIAMTIKPPGKQSWPAVFSIGPLLAIDDKTFTTQALAEDNGAEWFGPTEEFPEGRYRTACEVREHVYPNAPILPRAAMAIRNDRYKLVWNQPSGCEGGPNEYQFFDLQPTAENPLGLDQPNLDLLSQPGPMSLPQFRNYVELRGALEALLATEQPRPGDGNLDRRVDNEDLWWVTQFAGQPSWYDFNLDGTTDAADRAIVMENFGKVY